MRPLPLTIRPFSTSSSPAYHRLPHPQTFLQSTRRFHRSSPSLATTTHERSDPKAHTNFWKSHGRAIAKALTMAFFSYQVFYWAWITLETEQMKDQKGFEIKALEGEVRLLEEGRKSHRPAELGLELESGGGGEGGRLLEEGKRKG